MSSLRSGYHQNTVGNSKVAPVAPLDPRQWEASKCGQLSDSGTSAVILALFGSDLDTRDLETYPRTHSGHF